MLYSGKNWKGGFGIYSLLNFFLISFIFNLFITIYSVYSFVEGFLFNSLQGRKLKLKKGT